MATCNRWCICGWLLSGRDNSWIDSGISSWRRRSNVSWLLSGRDLSWICCRGVIGWMASGTAGRVSSRASCGSCCWVTSWISSWTRSRVKSWNLCCRRHTGLATCNRWCICGWLLSGRDNSWIDSGISSWRSSSNGSRFLRGRDLSWIHCRGLSGWVVSGTTGRVSSRVDCGSCCWVTSWISSWTRSRVKCWNLCCRRHTGVITCNRGRICGWAQSLRISWNECWCNCGTSSRTSCRTLC